jgi:hypothetical protein
MHTGDGTTPMGTVIAGKLVGGDRRGSCAAERPTSDRREAWFAAPEEMAYFDALNDASKTAFLNHAAKLEGLKDSGEIQKRSRWRHLPHWIESYWLPVRSDTATDGPVFFGSTHGLLANLADIAAASPHNLVTVPEHFRAHASRP